MACGCGKSVRDRQIIATANSGSAGAYPLFHFQGCTELHRGAFQGSSIYVVARGTSDERMFGRKMLTEAAEYARQVGAQVENLPTAALCHEAVLRVYGGAA